MVTYYRMYLVTGDDDKSVCNALGRVCTGMDVMVNHQLNEANDEFLVFAKTSPWTGAEITQAESSLADYVATYRFWDEYTDQDSDVE
ncbi:hypothetical protein I317_01387 [Kwoniella heveanensis CBS 569]|uniref:Uncharacterized protein n=1 Tax=Kwoniella heveanensis BCC8398 TaxID=1296120 RepID=A0A1B9GW29_9TREE|nr:hypothetical protein I316_02793 [Kwoniella heveanensis BCC8398]OCF44698.1 hypothetical protein I317_01387 [Kwoniella heveanensis CBS 569]